MNFFGRLFRTRPAGYVDDGMRLLHTLVKDMALPGWSADLQPSYSEEEIEAIDRQLRQFQQLADEEVGEGRSGSALFHPEAVPELRRTAACSALMSLGFPNAVSVTTLSADWKSTAATFLKASAGNTTLFSAPAPSGTLSHS